MLLAILCLGATNCKSQNMKDPAMEKEIKNVVTAFAKAGEERNVPAYNDILHEDFRVIANRYPTAEKTSIIPGEGYIALIAKETIGGTAYTVDFKHIDITGHSATVISHFKTEDGGGQLVTFLLVKNPENKWQLISDMATQIKK